MNTLIDNYTGLISDLDGVVYRGAQAVPHAVAALNAAHDAGKRIVYATNNAARTPTHIAEHLTELGINLTPHDVINSSQAGARRVAELVPPGSRVLAIGGPGVTEALLENGLTPVYTPELENAQKNTTTHEPPAAVLQGYGPDVSWHDLAQAAFAIQAGAIWVATNTDSTLPLAQGLAPGNGSLVGAVRNAVDTDPIAVGKPNTPLYEYSAQALNMPLSNVLALGDRLNTDIAGATNTGIDCLYVTTGVSNPIDVALASTTERPTHLAIDLRALSEKYTHPTTETGPSNTGTATTFHRARCGQATATWDNSLHLEEAGNANERLRAFIATIWSAIDAGEHITPSDLTPALDLSLIHI